MRDIEQLQRKQTEPATEAVVSECFIHSYYSSGIWPFSSISGRNHVVACVCEESTLQYICTIVYVYILWHDKQIYIQHFKIMKNVQPGHLYFPVLSLALSAFRHRHRHGKGRKNLITYFLVKRTRNSSGASCGQGEGRAGRAAWRGCGDEVAWAVALLSLSWLHFHFNARLKMHSVKLIENARSRQC